MDIASSIFYGIKRNGITIRQPPGNGYFLLDNVKEGKPSGSYPSYSYVNLNANIYLKEEDIDTFYSTAANIYSYTDSVTLVSKIASQLKKLKAESNDFMLLDSSDFYGLAVYSNENSIELVFLPYLLPVVKMYVERIFSVCNKEIYSMAALENNGNVALLLQSYSPLLDLKLKAFSKHPNSQDRQITDTLFQRLIFKQYSRDIDILGLLFSGTKFESMTLDGLLSNRYFNRLCFGYSSHIIIKS